MSEHPILFSKTTGLQSQKGKRLKSLDGLTWKQRNRDAVNARRRKLYAESPEKHRKRLSAYRKRNPSKVLAYNAKWRRKFFGVLRGNGQRLLVWLKTNGWPREGYQLLCCNCNQGKTRNGGVCPHTVRILRAA